MGHSPDAGWACGYLGMIHWLGLLGGPVDPDLALSMFERGCDLTDVQACIWGSQISAMLEFRDFAHAKSLAQRGCAMTTRSQFPEACERLGELHLMGDIHDQTAQTLPQPDYAAAVGTFDAACHASLLRSCSMAIHAALNLNDTDDGQLLEWGNTACDIAEYNNAALPCYSAFAALGKKPAILAQINVDLDDLMAQLEENCLNQGSDSCAGLSEMHRRYTGTPDLDAARFFAQRACDLGTCIYIEKIYVEEGAGAEPAELTALYLHRAIFQSTTMYDAATLGKLAADKAFFIQVVKSLQKSIGVAEDGRFKNSLYVALKQSMPM